MKSNFFNKFFLLDQKESKNHKRSYLPLQERALLLKLSDHAPHLVKNNSKDYFSLVFY
jgi:hypothetical protein